MILWMGLILVGYSDTNSGGGVEGVGGWGGGGGGVGYSISKKRGPIQAHDIILKMEFHLE